jgi:HEPN domain-containing protein
VLASVKEASIMREEARFWVDDAIWDLECAQDLLDNERHNYAVWLSRQSAEKLLKACYLIVLKSPVPRDHNLLLLGRECFGDAVAEINPQLTFLNPHYTTSRWVDAALGAPKDIYDREFAEQALTKAREVFRWIRSKVSLD